MGRLKVPYKPRDIFRDYHNSDKRYSLTVAHRRAGKTVARINKLIRKAVECKLLNPRFGYLAPYWVQAKDIAWVYLKHYSAPITALGGSVNESELSITLPHNNAIIKLYGAENAERMRGLYFDGLVVDEAQRISKTVLTEIILPTLADRFGWLDASGTPKGWSNLLGELYKLAMGNPDWFLQLLKSSETGIIPEEELANMQDMMSENEYNQEFECSFDAAITGAVYGKWMADLEVAGRITDKVQYDANYPVYTSWDLGFGDATAIWWYQVGFNEIIVLEYYENSQKDIKHYCDILKSKPYKYHMHYVPHDAANETLAGGGRSIISQMTYNNGISNVFVIPAASQGDSEEALRVTLPRCWFNVTNCSEGIDALKQYQYEWDNDKKKFKDNPRHDWSSHACDALELMARMWAKKPVTQKQLDKDKNLANFKRLRRINNVDKSDPYRLRSKR